MDIGNSIKAFDASTGKELWSSVIRPHLFPSSLNLVTQNGMLLVSDLVGAVALDQASGAIKWSVAPNDSAIQSYGAADSHSYYIGTRGAFVFALELTSGATRWERSLREESWIFGNVIGIDRSGDTLAVSGVYRTDPTTSVPQAFLVVLDTRDGRELWRHQSDTGRHVVFGAPAIADEVIMLPDALQRTLTAFDRRNGSIRWIINTDPAWGGPGSQPFVQDGIAYFGAADNHVYAADANSGAIKWRANLGSTVTHVVRCGNYVFGNSQGATIFDASDGRRIRDVIIGQNDFLTSEFALGDDRVFATGMVAAYALSCK